MFFVCAGLTGDDKEARAVSVWTRARVCVCLCVFSRNVVNVGSFAVFIFREQAAAQAWSKWEGSTSKLFFDPEFLKRCVVASAHSNVCLV